MSQIQIPKGWKRSRFGDLIDLKHGHQFRTSDYVKDTGYKVFKIGQLEIDNKIDLSNCDLVSKSRHGEFKDFIIKKGDILMALTGATLGRVVRIEEELDVVFQNYRVGNFKLKNDKLIYDYLYYLLQSDLIFNQVFDKINRAAQPNIGKENFENIEIIYPEDKKIQKRIVQKLDYILGQLEERKKEILQLINKYDSKKILKSYQNHLLSIAYHGKLTEKWRKDHQNIESSSILLEKIMKNRKLLNEKNSKKNKKSNNDEITIIGPNQNVKSWLDVKLENLIYIAGRIGWRGLKHEEYTDDGPLLLSAYNIKETPYVDLSSSYHISMQRYEESPEIQLKNDDILLVKDGYIGKLGIVKNLNQLATVNSSLLVIRSQDVFIPKFLYYYLAGPEFQKIAEERTKRNTVPHLFQKDLKNFILPVPPQEEQEEIVKILDKKMETLESVKSKIKSMNSLQDQIKNFLESMPNQILNQAFSGKLVN